MKDSLRLYSLTSYDRSAKIRWVLTELGLPFEERRLDRAKKEHEAEPFLRLNPLGRVPVLEIGDRVMFESGAICAYLADLYADRGLAPALAAPERLEYQQWMYFASATLDVLQIRVMVVEDIPPGEVFAAKEAALLGDVRDALSAVDRALAGRNFLVANRFSAADICVAYHLAWLRLWPEFEAIFADFPGVRSYVERLQRHPSAVQADVFSYPG